MLTNTRLDVDGNGDLSLEGLTPGLKAAIETKNLAAIQTFLASPSRTAQDMAAAAAFMATVITTIPQARRLAHLCDFTKYPALASKVAAIFETEPDDRVHRALMQSLVRVQNFPALCEAKSTTAEEKS